MSCRPPSTGFKETMSHDSPRIHTEAAWESNLLLNFTNFLRSILGSLKLTRPAAYSYAQWILERRRKKD